MIISRKSRETKQLIMAHSPYVTRLASRSVKNLRAKTDKKLGSQIQKGKKGNDYQRDKRRADSAHAQRQMVFLRGEGEKLTMCVCVCVCGGKVRGKDMQSFCSHFTHLD